MKTALVKSSATMLLALLPMAFNLQSAYAASGDITFEADTNYAESFSWSTKQNAFFVGSVRHGIVGKVSREGRFSTFICDPKLVSTTGVLVDDKRNTIWVANTDSGKGDRTQSATRNKLAGVATFDSKTGEAKAYYDLGRLGPGWHFANDIALDPDGNAYITDSFASVIYRITSGGVASVFAENALFKAGDGFNLNGIVWHEGGYLLAGKTNTGEIFRIDVNDPSHVALVSIPEALLGADGFHLLDNRHLIVVQNNDIDRAVELESNDDWKTAHIIRIVKSEFSKPTAVTKAGRDIFVLNSRLDSLANPEAPKVNRYLLQKF